ncbi:MAG TPA: T9SS type A sorting domain-containing protein [Chitinophagales bacterium]|nr:T9SS type A sorting domain-containing protein [Chitinophagales bacterium]
MKKQLTLLLFSFSFFLTKVFSQDVLYLDGSGAQPNLTIQSGASVYCQGGYVANATAQGMQLDGDLFVGDANGFTANWTDNMASSSVLLTSSGAVYFQSNIQQNITGANTVFYKVIFNNTSVNTSGIQLLTNITASNQANFEDGLVYANANTFYISSTASNAIISSAPNTSTYSSSWVAALYSSGGKLNREMVNSGSTYDFPVGSTTSAQLLQVSPTNISGISRFSSSWENGVSGNSPISISECGTSYTQVNNYGEWHLRPANGGAIGTGSFAAGNITLKGWNIQSPAFPGLIDNEFALLERADGDLTTAGWQVPNPSCTSLSAAGTPGRTVGGNYALRNNLTAFSDNTSQLGIGMTILVLPIELLSFTGWNEGAVNQLNWNTSAEYNSNYFDLERSAEGNDFSAIAKLSAAGFSTNELNYHFTDAKPNHGLNYYRLKMVDRDQTFTYSNIVLIKLNSSSAVSTVVSPNPVINSINIQLQSVNDGELLVQLTNALGIVVRSKTWQVVSGENFTGISTIGLPAAMYFVNIYRSSAAPAETYKVVKEN